MSRPGFPLPKSLPGALALCSPRGPLPSSAGAGCGPRSTRALPTPGLPAWLSAAGLIRPHPPAAHTVHHFGRAVIMFGVPYVYTQSRILKVSSAEGQVVGPRLSSP